MKATVPSSARKRGALALSLLALAAVAAGAALFQPPPAAALEPPNVGQATYAFDNVWVRYNGLGADDGGVLRPLNGRVVEGPERMFGFTTTLDADGNFLETTPFTHDSIPPEVPRPSAQLAGDPIPGIDITLNQAPGGKGGKPNGMASFNGTVNLPLMIPGELIQDLANKGEIDPAAIPDLNQDGWPDLLADGYRKACVAGGLTVAFETAGTADFGAPGSPNRLSGAPFLDEGAVLGHFSGGDPAAVRSVPAAPDPATDPCRIIVEALLARDGGTGLAGSVWMGGKVYLTGPTPDAVQPKPGQLGKPLTTRRRVEVLKSNKQGDPGARVGIKVPNTGGAPLTARIRVKSNRPWLKVKAPARLRVAPGRTGRATLRLRATRNPRTGKRMKAAPRAARVTVTVRGGDRAFRLVGKLKRGKRAVVFTKATRLAGNRNFP